MGRGGAGTALALCHRHLALRGRCLLKAPVEGNGADCMLVHAFFVARRAGATDRVWRTKEKLARLALLVGHFSTVGARLATRARKADILVNAAGQRRAGSVA